MKTARLSWAEVRQQEGDREIDVYTSAGSRLHGRAEHLDRLLEGCELMRLTKGVYQVTKWPEHGSRNE